MTDKIQIPIVFINSTISTDPYITEVQNIIDLLVPPKLNISKKIELQLFETNKNLNLKLWDMIRTNGIMKKNKDVIDLYKLWLDLGYTIDDVGIIIGFNDNNTGFNAKISMLFNQEMYGLFAYCPLQVWNTAINKK